MSQGPQPLLKPAVFMEIANIVAMRGISLFVETGTGPMSSGMEAARRLGLRGYTCDVYEPCVKRAYALYPDFEVYHATSVQMLNDCLPKMDGRAFFWLDGHCPTDSACIPADVFPLYDEMLLVKNLKRGYEEDVIWIDDIAMIVDPANPLASAWDVDLAGKPWHGDTSHTWAQYMAVFADTHDAEIDREECMLKLTPKSDVRE